MNLEFFFGQVLEIYCRKLWLSFSKFFSYDLSEGKLVIGLLESRSSFPIQ